jgi:hypothetical protein
MNPFAALFPTEKRRPADARSVTMSEGGFQICGYSADDVLKLLAGMKGDDAMTAKFGEQDKTPSGGYA